MGTCGFLRGLPETTDISGSWQLVVIDDDARRNAFIKKHGRMPGLSFRHVPDAFGRLLAKIGYCQVLTALDPGDFRPLVLPYITGEKKNVSYVVGKDGSPEADCGYRLTTLHAEHADGMILMVEVRLYANTYAPTYHVIVGDVSRSEDLRRIRDRLTNAA
jgi:hypothetical protein